jgi:hypothetical protein
MEDVERMQDIIESRNSYKVVLSCRSQNIVEERSVPIWHLEKWHLQRSNSTTMAIEWKETNLVCPTMQKAYPEPYCHKALSQGG